jgi:hypothetical protein
VPLRLEIGARDARAGVVTMARRIGQMTHDDVT